jgi:hypothetical protein
LIAPRFLTAWLAELLRVILACAVICVRNLGFGMRNVPFNFGIAIMLLLYIIYILASLWKFQPI